MNDWHQERNEYHEGSILDEQDRLDWEAQRADDLNLSGGRPSRADMIEAFAAERRSVESRAYLEHLAEKAAVYEWVRENWGNGEDVA